MAEFIAEEFLQESEEAILVSIEATTVWLPKSEIEYEGQPGDVDVDIDIPEWLAEKKELV